MNKTSIIRKIILLGIIIIFVNLLCPYAFGGCFRNNEINTDIGIYPETQYIDAGITKTCLGTIELRLKSTINKTYIIKNEKNETIDIIKTNYKSPELNHEINKKVSEINNGDVIIDGSILQENGKWKRTLININNPKDIIIIKGKNYGDISHNKSFSINKITIFIEIFIAILILLFTFLLYKNIKNTKKLKK